MKAISETMLKTMTAEELKRMRTYFKSNSMINPLEKPGNIIGQISKELERRKQLPTCDVCHRTIRVDLGAPRYQSETIKSICELCFLYEE